MTERIKMLMTQEPAENMSETKSTFEQYGIMTDFCMKDGEEVIDRVLSDKPDVVIMELFMTRIDSIGVMRAIRKKKPEKLPMFVVYSGFDSPALEREVMSAGATYFVLKPFNLGDLAENILRLSKRQRQKSKGGIRAAGFDGYNNELKETEIRGIFFADDTSRAEVNPGDAGGMLCVPLLYSKNWTAEVNGERAPVVNINGGLTGIPLRGGSCSVVMKYRLPGFSASVFVSAAACALLAAGMAAGTWRRRKYVKST